MPAHKFPALTLLTLLSVCTSAGAASPPPVAKGLWSVQRLTTFSPDPQPGATNWPGLNKPRAVRYTVCINEWRAAHPMGTPETYNKLKLIAADETGWQLRTQEGGNRMEVTYRRLDAQTFEGSNDVEVSKTDPGGAAQTLQMSTQYRAEFKSPDCGAVPPSSVSKFGEP